jgi:hypothetical protein
MLQEYDHCPHSKRSAVQLGFCSDCGGVHDCSSAGFGVVAEGQSKDSVQVLVCRPKAEQLLQSLQLQVSTLQEGC